MSRDVATVVCCMAACLALAACTEVKREKRQANHNQDTNYLQSVLNQYRPSNGPSRNLDQITPTTPRPQDVNCYVDVPMTRRMGGRCVPLGTSMGCQAGVYLGMSADCFFQTANSGRRNRVSRRWSRLNQLRGRRQNSG